MMKRNKLVLLLSITILIPFFWAYFQSPNALGTNSEEFSIIYLGYQEYVFIAGPCPPPAGDNETTITIPCTWDSAGARGIILRLQNLDENHERIVSSLLIWQEVRFADTTWNYTHLEQELQVTIPGDHQVDVTLDATVILGEVNLTISFGSGEQLTRAITITSETSSLGSLYTTPVPIHSSLNSLTPTQGSSSASLDVTMVIMAGSLLGILIIIRRKKGRSHKINDKLKSRQL